MADTKAVTYLKVPYLDEKPLRSLPIEAHHVLALQMLKLISDAPTQLNVMMKTLLGLLGPDSYARVAGDVGAGRHPDGLIGLFGAIVKATNDFKNGSDSLG